METEPDTAEGLAHVQPMHEADDLPPVVRLSLNEAADHVNVSRSTLQRRLHAGVIEGAERTDDGTWSIPTDGLLAAGLLGEKPANEPEPALETATPGPGEMSADELRKALLASEHARELDQLRGELAAVRAERDQLAERVTDLREAFAMAQRQLTAVPPMPPPEARTPAQVMPEPRRRWWQRS